MSLQKSSDARCEAGRSASYRKQEAGASKRRRFGYRRIDVILARQSIIMDLETAASLSRRELTVRERGGRKRALGREALRPRLGFVSDAFTDGRRFRGLAFVVDFSRGCLSLVEDWSLSSWRFARGLDAVIAQRETPRRPIRPASN